MKKKAGGRSEDWWREAIKRISGSPLMTKDACAEVGISPRLFYYWRKRLEPCHPSTEKFYPPIEIPLQAAIEIRTANGRTIVVRGTPSANHLREVLKAVEGEL